MAKKKLPISIFEIIWYSICALVIIWGIVYCCLGLAAKFLDVQALKDFANNFKSIFKLNIFYWGLIIFAIGAVAGSVVLIIFARTFDRANDREQRRSARLASLKKEDKVVSEQVPEVKKEAPVEEPKEEPQPVEEKPVEQEPVKEEPVEEAPVEEKPVE